jgi:hypothetical protein
MGSARTAAQPFSPQYQLPPGMRGALNDLDHGVNFAGLARAYYMNDQRIEWSGQEATFGAEGIVAGAAAQEYQGWTGCLAGELYINQPYDRNMLVDTPERRSYRGNFEYDTLELSQLYVSTRHDDWLLAAGKMVTPFGRYYGPVFSNSRIDTPFLRSESVLWRETGVLLQWHPGPLVFTSALTNGGPDRDANSSKAFIGRTGLDYEDFACGGSIKIQDGIGSEHQKTFNSHVGLDAMVRRGNWMMYGEVIYDKYGFRKPGYAADDITWGRSIYYRDQNIGHLVPITGLGYYGELLYRGERWLASAGYGQFFPKQIGQPQHDATTPRLVLKGVRHLLPFCDAYSVVIRENNLPNAQAGRTRIGFAMLAGIQVTF